jgi:hypothetical protein
VVKSHSIALEGENPGEDKNQEGLDRRLVLNPPLPERTLKGSKAVKSAKGTSPIT